MVSALNELVMAAARLRSGAASVLPRRPGTAGAHQGTLSVRIRILSLLTGLLRGPEIRKLAVVVEATGGSSGLRRALHNDQVTSGRPGNRRTRGLTAGG
jgi:hypothetical protein